MTKLSYLRIFIALVKRTLSRPVVDSGLQPDTDSPSSVDIFETFPISFSAFWTEYPHPCPVIRKDGVSVHLL